MIKHNVVDVLIKLSHDDIRQLTRFVNSEYFNRSESVKKLYNHIIKYYPSFASKNFTKEKIFARSFPGKTYNDSTYRGLMGDLLKLIYKFFVVEGLESDSLTYFVKLVNELYKREYLHLAQIQVNHAQSISQNMNADYNFYLNKYLLESYRFNIESELGLVKRKKQTEQQLKVYSHSDTFLGLFILTELASEYINLKVLESKYNVDISNCLIKKLVADCKMPSLIVTLKDAGNIGYVAELYDCLLKAYDSFKMSDYNVYKEKIQKYAKSISHEELTFHYSNLINCLVIKKNIKSSKALADELFSLYQTFLAEKLFKDDKIDYIKPELFRAILINTLECRQYEWCEQFIYHYSKKVHIDQQADMYNYACSQYYHAIGNTKKSLEYIDKMQTKNFIFIYDAYITKAKIYFEYANPQLLLDYLRTFSAYIRKDPFFSDERKIPYRNFIKYSKEIVRCFEQGDQIEVEFTRKLIEDNHQVVSKDWLIHQIVMKSKNALKQA